MHRGAMKRVRYESGILLFLRALAIVYLLIHLYLYLRDILSLPLLFIGFVAAFSCGLILGATKLRAVFAFLACSMLPFIIRFILFKIFTLQRGIVSSPEIDVQFFRFDSSFYPLYLPLLYVAAAGYVGRRTKKLIPWEVGINLLFLALLFWSQGRYQLSLYPHPVYAAFSVLAFIIVEIFILFLSEASSYPLPAKGQRGLARGGLPILGLIVFVLLSLFLLGRYTEGAVSKGGGLMKPTLFRFDFSKFLKLESEISMQDDLVLLLRREVPRNEAVSERILLRRFVLSGFRKGSGFYLEAEPGSNPDVVTVPDYPIFLPDHGSTDRVEVNQDYFLVNLDPESLIALNYPVSVTPYKNWNASSFMRIYRVVSKVQTLYPWDMADLTDIEMDEPLREFYTRYGGDPEIRNLAETITEGVVSYYDKVMAVVFYLMDNYQYSLKPGVAPDGDQLRHFLFTSRKGYCTYFAFSAALMLRSLGIPARVAVGFSVDESFGLLDFLPVRADMAHAWIEVYFGEYGWIEFDPTSQTLAPGEDYRFPELDMKEFTRLIEEVMKNEDLLVPENEEEKPGQRGFTKAVNAVSKALLFAVRYWYLFLPILYLLFLVTLRTVPYLAGVSVRDRRKRVKLLYHADMGRFSSVLALSSGRKQFNRLRGESILEWASRIDSLARITVIPWTEAYLEASFSGVFDEPRYLAALSSRARFLAAYREVPVWLRIAGFFIPARVSRRP